MLLIIVVFGKLFLQCRKLNIRLIPQSLNRENLFQAVYVDSGEHWWTKMV